jgi:hypothetical protein
MSQKKVDGWYYEFHNFNFVNLTSIQTTLNYTLFSTLYNFLNSVEINLLCEMSKVC